MDFVILNGAVRGSFTPTCSELYPLLKLWMTHQSITTLPRLRLVHWHRTVSMNHNFRDNDTHNEQIIFSLAIKWYTLKGQSQTMICLHTVVIAERFHYIVSSYASSTFEVTMCVTPDPCTPPRMRRGEYTLPVPV